MPPPITLSNSAMPVKSLWFPSVSTSASRGTGCLAAVLVAPAVRAALPVFCSNPSSNVFHSPQLGHLPAHFALLYPHSLHINTVFCFISPPRLFSTYFYYEKVGCNAGILLLQSTCP
jgi:hypothetical protein